MILGVSRRCRETRPSDCAAFIQGVVNIADKTL